MTVVSNLPAYVNGAGTHRVLPPGVHVAGISEVIERFVRGLPDEEHRAKLVRDLLDYVSLLRGHGLHVERALLDGSFTTDKLYPGDIDCSPLIDGATSRPTPEILASITNNWVSPKDRYKYDPVPGLGRTVSLDIYGVVRIPENHQNYSLGVRNETSRREFWQIERNGNGVLTKGCVEVIFDE